MRSASGRRVGERRAGWAELSASERPELPRRVRRYVDRIAFVERVAPPTEQAEDIDTARLVMRIQAGERELHTELYMRYFDRIYRYLRVLLNDAHEAEDATQEVFVDVLTGLERFTYRGVPVRHWLFTVARNTAHSRLRKGRAAELVGEDAIHATRERPVQIDPSVLGWLSDRELMMFVDRLPPVQRQVIAMRYLLDLSNVEIAEMLDRTPNDIAAIHRRGLGFLRQRLAAIGREPRPGRRTGMRAWGSQAPVLRHRRFALVR